MLLEKDFCYRRSRPLVEISGKLSTERSINSQKDTSTDRQTNKRPKKQKYFNLGNHELGLEKDKSRTLSLLFFPGEE